MEVRDIQGFYRKFGDKLPQALAEQLQKLENRLD